MKQHRLARRDFLGAIGAAAAAMACAPGALAQKATNTAPAKAPNIVFIYTDDQAPWALQAAGNPQAVTPNMDRLVKEGAYLVNSFVTTPVCSPARASLLTSRYSCELGIDDFIPHPGHKLYDENWAKVGIPENLSTFPELLAQAGYATGLVGKWHVGDWSADAENRFHPTKHGYQYFMGLPGGGCSPDNPELEKDGETQKFEGLTTDILADHAIDFIKKQQDKPFLLSLHHRAPHGKWLPVAEEDWAPFEKLDPTLPHPDYPDLNTKRVKKMMREYLASVHGVDRNLGRILSTLDELGLRDNTIVIFSSDHGYTMGHNGIWHKGNGIWATNKLPKATKNIAAKYRPNLYDNSLRVPTMVRWPGKIAPGTVIEESISSLDWLPTLAALAGASLPKDEVFRGRNFRPLLEGRKLSDWDNDFYAEYNMVNYSKAQLRCYRTPEWKLVRDFLNPERDELYHLKKDPEERLNRIHDKEVQEIVQALDKKIYAKMREINDPLLKEIKH